MDKQIYSFRKNGKRLVAVLIAAFMFSSLQLASADSWTANNSDQIEIAVGQTSYTLKRGDTLWALSQKINLTVEALAKFNNIDLANGEDRRLPVGRVISWAIKSDGQEYVSVNGQTYLVQSEDKVADNAPVGVDLTASLGAWSNIEFSLMNEDKVLSSVARNDYLGRVVPALATKQVADIPSVNKGELPVIPRFEAKKEVLDTGSDVDVEALFLEKEKLSDTKGENLPLQNKESVNLLPDRVHVMQVARQAADFIVIESNGLFGLVDAGASNLTTSKEVVYPYLAELGVKEFEFLLLTHLHGDHTGYLGHFAYPDGAKGTLLDDFLVKKVIMKDLTQDPNVPSSELASYSTLTRYLESKGVSYGYEDSFSLGDFSLSVYNEENLSEEELSRAVEVDGYDYNYNSLGVLVKKDDHSMFLAGDIEKYDEPKLANQIKSDHGTIDVLKVAHHGLESSTTDEFVNELQPQVGIVTHLEGVRPREDELLYDKFNGKENVVFTGDGTVVVDFTDPTDGLEVTKVGSDYEKVIVSD